MVLEFLAILATAAGGIAGVFGDTRDKKSGKLTRYGVVALSVVITAFGTGAWQAYKNHDETTRRNARETALSYYALASAYEPLSMLLNDSVGAGSRADRSGASNDTFPPNYNVNVYDSIRGDRVFARQLASVFVDGARTPQDNVDYGRNTTWLGRYYAAIRGIDSALDIYASHISSDALLNLHALRDHSLFRDAISGATRINRRVCAAGHPDQIIADLSQDTLAPKWRNRCAQVLPAELGRLFNDSLPRPALTPAMKRHHIERCKRLGYRRPFCTWAPLRASEQPDLNARPPRSP